MAAAGVDGGDRAFGVAHHAGRLDAMIETEGVADLVHRGGDDAEDEVIAVAGAALEAERGNDAGAAAEVAEAEDAPVADASLGGGDVDVGHAEDARRDGLVRVALVKEIE